MVSEVVRLHAFVRGAVQGVGFRWWTTKKAVELGLQGHARNLPDGRVEVVAEGPRDGCEALLALLSGRSPSAGRPGRVDGVTHEWLPAAGSTGGFDQV